MSSPFFSTYSPYHNSVTCSWFGGRVGVVVHASTTTQANHATLAIPSAAQRIGVELPAADRIATALNAWRQNATTSDKAKAGQLQRLVGQRNDLTASSDLRRIFFAPPVNTVQAVLVSSSHSEIPN